MAFGKKKTMEQTPVPEQTTNTAQTNPPVNKKNNNLCKVFRESVWETAKTFLVANEKFITTVNGEKKYVVLFLDANDVGGLDKKRAKGNQDKGQLIQQINAGTIKTYMTKDMLMDNAFVIIPDAATMDALSEFSMMTQAPYLIAYIKENADIEVTDDKVSFADASAVILGKKSLNEFLGGVAGSAVMDDDDEDDEDDEEFEDDEEDDEDDNIKDGDMSDSASDDEPDFGDDSLDELNSNDEPDFGDDEPSDGFDDSDDLLGPMDGEEDYVSEPQYDDTQDIPDTDDNAAEEYEYSEDTETGTQGFISRKFYSDELGLEISEEPFNIQFVEGNELVLFNEVRGDGWLAGYISEMSKDANSVLQNNHLRNIHKMKERYLRLMNIICEKIQRELDIYDENTYYGNILALMKEEHAKELENLDKTVAEKRDELERIWNKQIEDEGNRAAENAKHMYRIQNGQQHEREVRDVEANLRDASEIDYRNQVQHIMDKRRAEALSRLDMGITSVLKEVSDMYRTVLDDENKDYMTYYNSIMDFLDENRKDEVARIEVLSEQNRQKEEADKTREEYAARLDGMTAEFEAKQKTFLSDIEKLRAEQDARFASTKSDCEARVAEADKRTEEIQEKYNELLDKYTNINKQKDVEYEARIKEMGQINQSLQDRCEYIQSQHNSFNKVSIFLGIAIIIIGITVGFIIGAFVNIRNTSSEERKQLEQQIEQQSSEQSTAGTNNAIIIGDSMYMLDLDD